jgi:NitT/TauT family transport system substrate-binding protein
MRNRYLATLLLIAVFLSACSAVQPAASTGSDPASELVDLTACTSATGFGNWPFFYAEATGLFPKYGLRVTEQEISSGSDAMAAMLAGDVDLCHIGGAAVVNAALAIDGPVIVAGLVNRQPYSLVVAQGIEDPADLLGKALAVSSPGSASDSIMRSALQAIGLNPDTDVTIVAVGGQAERLASMESGQVAGTVLTLSELGNALRMGYHVLVDMADLGVPYQHTSVATMRTFLEENPKTVEQYLKALLEARALMESDPEQGPQFIANALLIDSDQEMNNIREIYDTVVRQYLEKALLPTPEGVEVLIAEGSKENPTARDITADDVIDDSIVRELERSGFIAGLYAQ